MGEPSTSKLINFPLKHKKLRKLKKISSDYKFEQDDFMDTVTKKINADYEMKQRERIGKSRTYIKVNNTTKVQELQKFIDILTKAEATVHKTLNEIDQSLMETDVEWMNMSSLAKKDRESPPKTQLTSKVSEDYSVPLNLDPQIPNSRIDDGMEEWDSD